jgi:hypothetical protein
MVGTGHPAKGLAGPVCETKPNMGEIGHLEKKEHRVRVGSAGEQSVQNKANVGNRDQRKVLYGKGVMFDSVMMRNKANWPCRANGGHSPPYQAGDEATVQDKANLKKAAGWRRLHG